MAHRLWLIFAQTVTVALALLGLTLVLPPQWVPATLRHAGSGVVTLRETDPAPVQRPAAAGGYRDAAQKALPAMVNIFTSKEVRVQRNPLLDDPLFQRFFGEQLPRTQRSTSLGSGVIVSQEGYIVTNNHVVEAADQISVTLSDGRQFSARVVGSDPESDLAVLKVDADKLQPVVFGHIKDVQVGDVVLAIGNPFGVGQTVTMGIVSALGRSKLGINAFENFIQTDAPINPGNSGGALIDSQGHLIGINTAIFSRSGGSLGIGFAIPENTVRDVLTQLVQQGYVVRGWAGVATQDVTRELAASFGLREARGALVTGLLAGAPGALAGLQPGDVIVGVDEQRVNGSDDLRNLIAMLKPGTRTTLTLVRGRKEMQLAITVARRPAPGITDE